MTPSAQTSSVSPPTLPALVGREREERLLLDYLTIFLSGKGRLVLIGGEAGIGKTSLVATTARAAMSAGAIVLRGCCYDLSATPPYGPWREIAAELRGIGGLTALSDTLAVNDEIAVVGGQGSSSPGPGGAGGGCRDPAADARAGGPALGGPRQPRFAPVHRSPVGICAAAFRRHLPRRRALRHHPLYHLLPNLVREASAERLALRPLDETAVRELVTASYPMPDPAAARLIGYLQAHAEGNPFYVRELLRSLEAEGTLRAGRDGWALGDLTRRRVPALAAPDRRWARRPARRGSAGPPGIGGA